LQHGWRAIRQISKRVKAHIYKDLSAHSDKVLMKGATGAIAAGIGTVVHEIHQR
jgi:hypothetical protein